MHKEAPMGAVSISEAFDLLTKAGIGAAAEKYRERAEKITRNLGAASIEKVYDWIPDAIEEIPLEHVPLFIDWVAFFLEGLIPRIAGPKYRVLGSMATYGVQGVRMLGSGAVVGFIDAVAKAKTEKRKLTVDEFAGFLEEAMPITYKVMVKTPHLRPGQLRFLIVMDYLIDLRNQGWYKRIGSSRWWRLMYQITNGALSLEEVVLAIPDMSEAEFDAKMAKLNSFENKTEIMTVLYQKRRDTSSMDTPAGEAAREAQKTNKDILEPAERTAFNDLQDEVERMLDACRGVFTAIRIHGPQPNFLRSMAITAQGVVTDRLLNAGGGERLADSADNVRDLIWSWYFWKRAALPLLAFLAPFLLMGAGLLLFVTGLVEVVHFLIGNPFLGPVTSVATMFVGWTLFFPGRHLFGVLAHLVDEVRNQIDGRHFTGTTPGSVLKSIVPKFAQDFVPGGNASDVLTAKERELWRWDKPMRRNPHWLSGGAIYTMLGMSVIYIPIAVLVPTVVLATVPGATFRGVLAGEIAILITVLATGSVAFLEWWQTTARWMSYEEKRVQSIGFWKSYSWRVAWVGTLILCLAPFALIGSAVAIDTGKSFTDQHFFPCPTKDTIRATSRDDLRVMIPDDDYRDYCVDTKIRQPLARR
jgi:hypothetical protein